MKLKNNTNPFLITRIVLIVILLLLLAWDISIKSNPVTNYRVLILDKNGKTLIDKRVMSLSPMELDTLTKYLNKR